MSDHPKVSVILPVFNGENLVDDAINSVLNQTFADFELIVLDDGSKDETWGVINSVPDPRVKPYRHDNMGLPKTLNRGISIARAPYIARLDHDDLMLPERLQKQVEFLDANPNVGMVGTWAQIYEDSLPSQRFHKHPASSTAIRLHLLFDNPFVHASVMLRRDVFDSVGFYTEEPDRLPPEDYELWSRVARRFDVANIPDILTIYREVQSSLSRVTLNPFLEKVLKFSSENIYFYVSKDYDLESCMNVAKLYHGQKGASKIIEQSQALDIVNLAASCILGGSQPDPEFEKLLADIKHNISAKYGFTGFRNRMKHLFSAGMRKLMR
ncbi:glycosyltransferase family 2 protein [Pannonibacter phragmitetus]|uniref:glycosyltransferase family 2 protein n=1 Tax=Pannonibacter phragmitetus TaxID=121719 RepID=UPI000B2104AF|nr:glycosyltransferase family A protein [Pannonibacter phragmitetus]